jgi:hypothetical protein
VFASAYASVTALLKRKKEKTTPKMQTASLPFQLPFSGGDGEGQNKSPRNTLHLPFLPFVGGSSRRNSAESLGVGDLRPSTMAAAQVQNVSLELQLKQAALENTLSDAMVELVHTQEQLARANSSLDAANKHIEEHAARETMMAVTLDTLEELFDKLQHEMEERLDVEELVGFRSYSQKRDKELQARLHLLQDLNDQKDVVLQEQAAEIAWLKNQVAERTSDLEVAVEDLKISATREWKKHRSVCMEIGGIYIDFNHREDVGLTMDRSHKYGSEELGMVGIGLKLGNVFPFEVLAVHPDSRTTDGLPAVLHEGDRIVAIDDVNCENLTKADINGLIIGPAESSVSLKILRGKSMLPCCLACLLVVRTVPCFADARAGLRTGHCKRTQNHSDEAIASGSESNAARSSPCKPYCVDLRQIRGEARVRISFAALWHGVGWGSRGVGSPFE